MSGHGNALAREFHRAIDDHTIVPRVDRRHGGDVDAWAQRNGFEAEEMLDFSASINPLAPPPAARWAFLKSYQEISRYPDPYGDKLKAALAERHGLSPREVLLGNGSTQLIYLLCAALRPRRALIVGPAFAEYANALTLCGAEIQLFALSAEDGFELSMRRFMAAWDKDCDLIVLTTPNSVTGRLIPNADLANLARIAATRKCFLVVDEAFIDFVEAESVKLLVCHNPYLIVLRSLTKYYALPGLRIGYLLAETRLAARLAIHHAPWSINAPALNVARACLEDTAFEIRTARWLARERAFLTRRLAALRGFRPFPSQANFLLVKLGPSDCDALQLRSFLASRKILIRACDSFAELGSDYFRVAVKRRKDNLRLLAALAEWSAAEGRITP
jgi:threonine-phosphate decarboxylase